MVNISSVIQYLKVDWKDKYARGNYTFNDNELFFSLDI